MITKEQAMQCRYGEEIHYTGNHECTKTVGPRGGVTINIQRVRVSGKCKTWKRSPEKFSLPVKYGLYDSSHIDAWNAEDWHLAADCPLAKDSQ